MSTTYTYPIVGAKYRRPAQAVLDNLALNTPLVLFAEPTNPYDEFAIGISIIRNKIPKEVFVPANLEYLQLGYLPREVAKKLRTEKNFPRDATVPGTFYLSSTSNAPQVRFELPSESEASQ